MQAYNGPKRFAHRGVTQAAVENTIPAFQAAADLGLEGVELDIRQSADAELIVIHDANLTRHTLGHPTMPSNGSVATMRWQELQAIELPYANHLLEETLPNNSEDEFLATLPYRQLGQEAGRGYETELQREPRMGKIPRLADFLAWFQTAPATMMAEIELNAVGIVAQVFSLLANHPARERCIVFSGNPLIIGELQQASGQKPPGVKLGANIRFLTEETRAWVQEMDLYEVGLNAEHIIREDLDWLHKRDILAFANLGDYPAWWQQLKQLPVDGMKTNYAAALTKWWLANP